MVNNLAMTQVQRVHFLHVLFGESEIPNVKILFHALRMDALGNNGHAPLRVPFPPFSIEWIT